MPQINAIKGDITKIKVNTIVNAANTTSMGGGGVDGAVHRAADPALYGVCEKSHGCSTGEAWITGGFNLPAKFIIHTPGPIWRGGDSGEDQLLANSYHNSLLLADKHLCRTVAFPLISTGVYVFPLGKAAKIAIRTIKDFFPTVNYADQVTMVCFDDKAFTVYHPQPYQTKQFKTIGN